MGNKNKGKRFYVKMIGEIKDPSLHTKKNKGVGDAYCYYPNHDDADDWGYPLAICCCGNDDVLDELKDLIMNCKGKIFLDCQNVEIILNDIEFEECESEFAEFYTTADDFLANTVNIDADF